LGQKIDLSKDVNIAAQGTTLSILPNNTIVPFKSGAFSLSFKYKDLKSIMTGEVTAIEDAQVDQRLKMSNGGVRVPVVILRLMPTADGLTLNEKIGPDSYFNYNYPTIDIVKQKFNEDNVITKAAGEYGTRFRDYGNNARKPYVYYDVVKQFDVYEFALISRGSTASLKTLDFKSLFAQINLSKYVNERGVKEVWVSHFHKFGWESVLKNGDGDSSTYWSIEESNMSSPSSGDISNSARDNNDLPVYNSTYVVYAHYGTAGASANLHVRGHQIEAQLYWLDDSPITVGQRKLLFSDLFVGSGNGMNNMPLGRVGMTHFPPNTTVDYDYNNKTLVQSDISDWIPSGGKKRDVNVNTWLSVTYPFQTVALFTQKCGQEQCTIDWSNNPEFMWHLYWFQSIPGENNSIPYGTGTLTNWWDLFYNWDDAVRGKKKLWK
jgi:hypothetical protein